MRAIYPGRPQSKLQALCTGYWDGLRVITYISGNAVIILKGPQEILQTIYVDDVDDLEAVAIEETSGRIAVIGEERVYIYGPLGRDEGVLKWSQIHELEHDELSNISTLSWGSSDELLVGGVHFALWNIPESEESSQIWKQKLANPVKLAQFSYDGGLIASCGYYDRLVKVWRRLSYELDGTRFDVSYLPHPSAVTNMHWRKPWHAEQNLDNLLYTFCSDNKIRIWAHSDPHAKSVMQHITDIDMNASIQPRRLSVNSMSKRRYGFVLDSRDFSKATEKAVEKSTGNVVDHSLEHLVEIANRSPEICIVLDGLGHMSAWGLENAGCKNRQSTTIFNVAHVDGMNVFFGNQKKPEEDFARLSIFSDSLSDSNLTILSHTFDGKIDWYDAQITELFDPSPRKDRVRLVSSWTGHDASINKITPNATGSTLLSVTEENQGILWTCGNTQAEPTLLRKSLLDLKEDVLQSLITADGDFVIFLQPRKISLWDTRNMTGKLIAHADCSVEDANGCVVLLEDPVTMKYPKQVTAFDSKGTVETWRLNLSQDMMNNELLVNDSKSPIEGYLNEQPNDISKIAQILPIHYASLFGETAIAVSRTGVVQALKHDTNTKCSNSWSPSVRVNTFLDDPLLVQAGPSGKLAAVDTQGTTLTIWDLKNKWLEFEEEFPDTEKIEKLVWTATKNDHAVLAVGLQHRIVVFAQLRFISDQRESWGRAVEIRMRDFATHSLGDLSWLDDGNLLIGAGNQMFVHEVSPLELGNTAMETEQPVNLFQLVDLLNGSLPIFHPEYMHHLLTQGKLHIVQKLLGVLYKKLRFWSEGDELPSDLGLDLETMLISPSASSLSNGLDEEDEDYNVIEERTAALAEYLTKSPLPQFSSLENARLQILVNQVASLQSQKRSIDSNALRYLHLSEYSNPTSHNSPYRSITFAFRSASQEILISHLSSTKLTWLQARSSGLFSWLSPNSPVALQTSMETIARNEYTASDDRSPVTCSLFYLALRKKSVLQGLWRMVPGLREQSNTLKLLANNFGDQRWRTTAMKNGYALLSKRRFEYGAAFFLLGNSLKDAVNVCVHQLKDVQLAIAIARVYGGDDIHENSVLRTLLVAVILPSAAERGDRWAASWAFEMLGEKEKALQACLRPLHELLDTTNEEEEEEEQRKAGPQAMYWRNFDPALAILYVQLRAELAKTSKGGIDVGGITEKEEWDFVLRCAGQYTRQGCDWLALDLVRNWEFLPREKRKPVAEEEENGSHEEENTEEDESHDGDGGEESDRDAGKGTESSLKDKPKPKPKPAPTQFQEPDASSLLDSFGF